MDIRSILLHLDAGPGSISQLALAHGLADRFDARLTVLFGSHINAAKPGLAYSIATAAHDAEACERAHYIERDRLQALHLERGGDSMWCDASGDLVDALVAEAAYADLLIAGPAVGMGDITGAPLGFVEHVVLRSGTPTLVVPYPHRQESLSDSVLIAWDGSAQAARAVRTAIPLLRHAAHVHIASWSAQTVQAPFSRLDLTQWLKRHDIGSEMHQHDATPRVGDALAALASELRSDLLVMGCYGHSRLCERMFGGTTRSVLASLPVPVLLAH